MEIHRGSVAPGPSWGYRGTRGCGKVGRRAQGMGSEGTGVSFISLCSRNILSAFVYFFLHNSVNCKAASLPLLCSWRTGGLKNLSKVTRLSKLELFCQTLKIFFFLCLHAIALEIIE